MHQRNDWFDVTATSGGVNGATTWTCPTAPGEVRYRENIPLTVMSVISLAVLLLFGISEIAMRANDLANSGPVNGPAKR
jgi:hypothetical protein